MSKTPRLLATWSVTPTETGPRLLAKWRAVGDEPSKAPVSDGADRIARQPRSSEDSAFCE